MKPFTIGILGGMGPRATVQFEQRLIDMLEGDDQAMPRIITINDGSIWDRSRFLNEGGDDPLEQLVPNAQLLRLAGADVVCLPCNTAHAGSILARLQSLVPLPVIDMPAACIVAAQRRGLKKLLILGTDGTRRSQVYQSRAFGIAILPAGNEEQKVIDTVIRLLKRGQLISSELLSSVVAIIKNAQADGVVLACTELSFLRDNLQNMLDDIDVIDSTDELVARCASLYCERKGAVV